VRVNATRSKGPHCSRSSPGSSHRPAAVRGPQRQVETPLALIAPLALSAPASISQMVILAFMRQCLTDLQCLDFAPYQEMVGGVRANFCSLRLRCSLSSPRDDLGLRCGPGKISDNFSDPLACEKRDLSQVSRCRAPPHGQHAGAGMLGLKARDLGRRLIVVIGPHDMHASASSGVLQSPQASLNGSARHIRSFPSRAT
jgi:hypothetical protein